MLRMAALLLVCFSVGLSGSVGVAAPGFAAVESDYPGPPKPRPTKEPLAVPKPQEIPPQREQGCTAHDRVADPCHKFRTECECVRPCEPNPCEIGCTRPQACRNECSSACKHTKNYCSDHQPRGDGKAATLPSNGMLKIEDFALYADRSIRLGDCSRVEGGNLGVRSFAETNNAQLQIGKKAWIDPQRIISAYSVSIGQGVTFGLVAATRFRDNGIALAPPAAFQADRMPPVPLAKGGGSKPDISVNENEALALLPGEYGTLSIDGVLVLNPGHYRVSKVQIRDEGRLRAIVGSVRLDIGGTLSVGRRAAIQSDFGLSARHIAITIAGEDEGGVPSASFGEASVVRALVVAPHGSLNFADRVKAKGAFAAFDIAAGEHVEVTFEDGFPSADPTEHGTQQLSGYFTPPIRDAPLVSPVPRTQIISLGVGLPSRDPSAMRQAAHDVSDPASASFRKHLTLNQFAAAHGATQADYQSVVDWANAHGLTVTKTYPNRLLVSVSGTAAQVEQALYIGLNLRRRPDGTSFYAADRDPSLDLSAKLLWISGLDNRVIATPGQGTGPGGRFNSSDLRAAYTACTNLTGAGQSVGLFELDGFTAADIPAYACRFGGATCNAAGQPTSAVPNIVTTLLDGATGAPTTVLGSTEVTLDIQMAMAVAPGLASIQVFEAPNTGNVAFHNDILTSMATTLPLINQISSSWFFNTDANTQQTLYQLALQGQTFLQASGDQGAISWSTDPGDIRSLDAVTVVGGTTLTLNTPAGLPASYGSETTWNANAQGASGGGIAANVNIPTYQTGINMSSNGGSTTKRNLPDVAAVAANLGIVFTNPTSGTQSNGGVIGTSAAAPIWAGLIAIANQISASTPTGAGRVGNANAFLYSIGKNTAAYGLSFNDVTTGNNNGSCSGSSGISSGVCVGSVPNPVPGLPPIVQNTWNPVGGNFSAAAGYDLATGLGTPRCALLNELATGSTSALPSPPVNITYHQTGACNGFAKTGGGIVSAGPNAAFVVFGIEKVDNSGGNAAFNFDPSKLYVQQAIQQFMSPGLSIYPEVLGPFAAVQTSVAKGTTMQFNPVAQGALVASTTNADGSTEANQTAYFLKYSGSSTAPTVTLTKSDASRTSWPNTQDCKTITLQ